MRRGDFFRYCDYALFRIALLVFISVAAPSISLAAAVSKSAKDQGIKVSGVAVQGPMRGATVTAYAVNPKNGSSGEKLGTAITGVDGSFALTLKKMPRGPVRLTASGGDFVSEEDAAVIATPSSISVLLANVKGDTANVSINPLTEFVDSLATGMLGKGKSPDLTTTLILARKKIQSFYGMQNDPATVRPDYTKAGIGNDAGTMGLALGALIDEDQRLCSMQPGGLVAALSADIADGFYDGQRFGKKINYCGDRLIAIAGTAAYQDALSGLQQLRMLPANPFMRGGSGNPLGGGGTPPQFIIDAAAVLNIAIVQAVPPPENRFALDTPQMNVGRVSATATLLRNGRVLIAGGFGVDGAPLSSAELYDPAANCFAGNAGTRCAPRVRPAMNVARSGAAASLLQNGKVLISGGTAETVGSTFHALTSTEIYNPVTNSFLPSTPAMAQRRLWHTSTSLPNGRVLIAGGVDSTDYLRSAELYDPISNTFNPVPTGMHEGRSGATATSLLDGKVLIAGGLRGADAASSVDLYDPESDSFVPIPPSNMNVARTNAAAVLLPSGKVLIAGGFTDHGLRDALDSVEIYDPDIYGFEAPTPRMNENRGDATATLLPNGKAMIPGGRWFLPLQDVEIYDPETNSFGVDAPSMNENRSSATATLLFSGRLLVDGGAGRPGPHFSALDSVELYTP